MMSDKEKAILDAVVLRDDRKVLTCAMAVRLSREQDMSLKEIGDACDRLGIKIRECQLGCFA
jgi:hypothetical protein